MAHERLKDAALPHAVSDVVSDLADLFQKEMRLARTELTAKLTTKLTAGVWMSAAGVLAVIASFLVLQAAVFAIASYDIAMHWSCLIVAGIVVAIAIGLYLKGRSDAREEMAPRRTINQIKQDISIAKEQLT
jgi:putative superfamily III holin-X